MKTVLFIQHASAFGGSAMSLIYTLRGISKQYGENYKLLIALAKWTKELSDYYQKEGFEIVECEWIDTYEHTQGVSHDLRNPFHIIKEIKQQLNISKAKTNTLSLLKKVKPDIVHLNSVVLLGSAKAVREAKIPLVWHVREPSVKGIFGYRRSKIRKCLKEIPNKTIFICEADRKSWGAPGNGEVVYNFVDFNVFDKSMPKLYTVENKKIPKADFTILFLGGVSEIKGGIFLLRALNNLQKKYPKKKIQLLLPGGEYNIPNYFIYRLAQSLLPLIGLGTHSNMIEKEISKLKDKESVIRFKFVKDIAKLFCISDVLVFPSTRPHFARPIIEAGAMGKPVIGSRLGGVEELIENEKSGFLIEHKNALELEEKLDFFINNNEILNIMGSEGYRFALEKFKAENNVLQIVEIYKNL